VLGVHGRQVLQPRVPEGALEGAQGGVQAGAAGAAGGARRLMTSLARGRCAVMADGCILDQHIFKIRPGWSMSAMILEHVLGFCQRNRRRGSQAVATLLNAPIHLHVTACYAGRPPLSTPHVEPAAMP
jgi:hypothetical protein